MPLEVSEDSPAAIIEFLESTNETAKYLVVYASPRPTDGLLWCGDCRRAEPFINKKFSAHPEQVKVVYVGSEAEWKVSTNPYRKSPFLIERLPTIVKVAEAKINGTQCWLDEEAENVEWTRLVEGHCYNQEKLDDFVNL